MTTRRAVILQGIGWLMVLAPFFFLTYGMANQFTAGRENIGSLVFGWEHRIPFIPLTIIPYWSLDLLYGLSLFICVSLNEQRRLVCRLVLASLVACAGFLLFPLRFTFIRPEMTGLANWLFGQLEQFDLPYNQSPSLHIILCWLLWRHFHHHLSGVWQKLSAGWFLVIGASVLTTWQHHVIDVVTGLAVGLVIDWLIPQTGTWRWRMATGKRRKLAGYYCCGALVCLAGTFLTTWFWWPALALAIVALAYGAAGVDALQKDEQGSLTPAAWLLLLPWRAGMWLSMRLYTRHLPAVSPLMEGVSLGAYPRARPEQLAVLDLTSEFPRSPVVDNVAWRCVPMLDLVNPDDAALHRAVSELEHLRTTQGSVLLHCALGLSRSALVAAAWLIQREPDLTVAQAIARVRAARPAVVFTAEHIELLKKWKTKWAA
ncbi:phosphatase PAP2/dual specificity phosphatase family protein [Vibrio fluvialis]|uniref:phosphatase PAP2/dual specificity phosphatase family protein n=1 Tax=Vibrio fluvialis TaxID=676 RepID=UPI00192AB38D|nr:phosphatase PAP2/dual specificity phosphatase family protein [Vibrio fluvialis]MBL4277297.1 phosphatase PAP2/dual specificity phosphatase family protein [Vibrio fluvialis]